LQQAAQNAAEQLIVTRSMQAVVLAVLACGHASASGDIRDDMLGAWEAFTTDESGRNVRNVVIFTHEHQVAAWFDADTGELITTNGGLWSIDGTTVTETVEFHADNPERVGTSISFDVELTDDSLSIVGYDMHLNRVDRADGKGLSGSWQLIADDDVKRDPAISDVWLVTPTRFQWIQFNAATGELIQTLGGGMQVERGTIVETADFFSTEARDLGTRFVMQFEKDHAELSVWGPDGTDRSTAYVWHRRDHAAGRP
jgi:hypothetical protein